MDVRPLLIVPLFALAFLPRSSADPMFADHAILANQGLPAIYQRVTGQKFPKRPVGLPPGTTPVDPQKIARWEKYVENDQRTELYSELLNERAFAATNFANFTSKISNEDATSLQPFDDFQTLLYGVMFLDLDMRKLFTHATTIYSNDRVVFRTDVTALDVFDSIASGKTALNFRSQEDRNGSGDFQPPPAMSLTQRSDVGLLTSRGFQQRFLSAGTNRRPVRAAFDLFLCTKIEAWKDASLPDLFVGRDVDRSPGKDPKIYRESCRACHSPMDGFRGAWAHYDFPRPYSERVVAKYNINSDVYPGGYVTRASDWYNMLTSASSQNYFGWQGPQGGGDLASFGELIASSDRFSHCMVRRTMETVCPYTDVSQLERENEAELKSLSQGFKTDGYQLRSLFKNVLLSPLCR